MDAQFYYPCFSQGCTISVPLRALPMQKLTNLSCSRQFSMRALLIYTYTKHTHIDTTYRDLCQKKIKTKVRTTLVFKLVNKTSRSDQEISK